MSQQIARSLNYVHKSDINIAPVTIPLHGVNLSANQFILLYDSTPYASKGHIALNLPCDANTPNVPIFQVLVGRAPNLTPLALGYISPISVAPQMCVYHGQFGFGEPITDIVLKNVSGRTISLEGPHSVAISTHEFYTPSTPSLEQIQHQQQKWYHLTMIWSQRFTSKEEQIILLELTERSYLNIYPNLLNL